MTTWKETGIVVYHRTFQSVVLSRIGYNLVGEFQMLTATAKQQILENAGYAYSFDRRSYINRSARKVFSLEFIQDHTEGELQTLIEEPAPARSEWSFYFNSPPSEAVKRELTAILG